MEGQLRKTASTRIAGECIEWLIGYLRRESADLSRCGGFLPILWVALVFVWVGCPTVEAGQPEAGTLAPGEALTFSYPVEPGDSERFVRVSGVGNVEFYLQFDEAADTSPGGLVPVTLAEDEINRRIPPGTSEIFVTVANSSETDISFFYDLVTYEPIPDGVPVPELDEPFEETDVPEFRGEEEFENYVNEQIARLDELEGTVLEMDPVEFALSLNSPSVSVETSGGRVVLLLPEAEGADPPAQPVTGQLIVTRKERLAEEDTGQSLFNDVYVELMLDAPPEDWQTILPGGLDLEMFPLPESRDLINWEIKNAEPHENPAEPGVVIKELPIAVVNRTYGNGTNPTIWEPHEENVGAADWDGERFRILVGPNSLDTAYGVGRQPRETQRPGQRSAFRWTARVAESPHPYVVEGLFELLVQWRECKYVYWDGRSMYEYDHIVARRKGQLYTCPYGGLLGSCPIIYNICGYSQRYNNPPSTLQQSEQVRHRQMIDMYKYCTTSANDGFNLGGAPYTIKVTLGPPGSDGSASSPFNAPPHIRIPVDHYYLPATSARNRIEIVDGFPPMMAHELAHAFLIIKVDEGNPPYAAHNWWGYFKLYSKNRWANEALATYMEDELYDTYRVHAYYAWLFGITNIYGESHLEVDPRYGDRTSRLAGYLLGDSTGNPKRRFVSGYKSSILFNQGNYFRTKFFDEIFRCKCKGTACKYTNAPAKDCLCYDNGQLVDMFECARRLSGRSSVEEYFVDLMDDFYSCNLYRETDQENDATGVRRDEWNSGALDGGQFGYQFLCAPYAPGESFLRNMNLNPGGGRPVDLWARRGQSRVYRLQVDVTRNNFDFDQFLTMVKSNVVPGSQSTYNLKMLRYSTQFLPIEVRDTRSRSSTEDYSYTLNFHYSNDVDRQYLDHLWAIVLFTRQDGTSKKDIYNVGSLDEVTKQLEGASGQTTVKELAVLLPDKKNKSNQVPLRIDVVLINANGSGTERNGIHGPKILHTFVVTAQFEKLPPCPSTTLMERNEEGHCVCKAMPGDPVSDYCARHGDDDWAYGLVTENGVQSCMCEPACYANQSWDDTASPPQCIDCPAGQFRKAQLKQWSKAGEWITEQIRGRADECTVCSDLRYRSSLVWRYISSNGRVEVEDTRFPSIAPKARPDCVCETYPNTRLDEGMWTRPFTITQGWLQAQSPYRTTSGLPATENILKGNANTTVDTCNFDCSGRTVWTFSDSSCSRKLPEAYFPWADRDFWRECPFGNSQKDEPQQCPYFDSSTGLCGTVTCSKGESTEYWDPQFWGASGALVRGGTCRPCSSIIPGSTYAENCACVCPPGKERRITDGKVQCLDSCDPQREKYNAASLTCDCLPSTRQVRGSDGHCACPGNSYWNANSTPKRCDCSGGRIWNGTAPCVCPLGSHWNGTTCVTCASGETWDGTKCARPTCVTGQVNIGGTCYWEAGKESCFKVYDPAHGGYWYDDCAWSTNTWQVRASYPDETGSPARVDQFCPPDYPIFQRNTSHSVRSPGCCLKASGVSIQYWIHDPMPYRVDYYCPSGLKPEEQQGMMVCKPENSTIP